jgi:hypothetical protein
MNQNELKLLIWKDNWADEMDLESFVITDKTGYEKWLEEGKNQKDFEISFGTNEWNEYSYFRELQNTVKIKDISQTDAETIVLALNLKKKTYLESAGIEYYAFGIDNFFAQILQRFEDEDMLDDYDFGDDDDIDDFEWVSDKDED